MRATLRAVSVPLLFFALLGLFVAVVCLLGLLYRGGPEQLLDWSAERATQQRAAADALDLRTLLETTNRVRRAEGREPLSDEELRRRLAS